MTTATVATGVAALVSSLAAIGALYFTAIQSGATQDQIAQAEQSQITSRYTAAVEQLGSEALEVRLGGIYALERLAGDSPRDRETVVDVLAAYVRGKLPNSRSPACNPSPAQFRVPPTNDVDAALEALSRRNLAEVPSNPTVDSPKLSVQYRLDLSQICLFNVRISGPTQLSGTDLHDATLQNVYWYPPPIFTGSDLTSANLGGSELNTSNLAGADLRQVSAVGSFFVDANLSGVMAGGANFSSSFLDSADLRGADFTRTVLIGTSLEDADMSESRFASATLRGAELTESDLTNADLRRADLTFADLSGANLTGANLFWANLAGANLTGANLTGANLTGANLTGAQGAELSPDNGLPAFPPGG